MELEIILKECLENGFFITPEGTLAHPNLEKAIKENFSEEEIKKVLYPVFDKLVEKTFVRIEDIVIEGKTPMAPYYYNILKGCMKSYLNGGVIKVMHMEFSIRESKKYIPDLTAIKKSLAEELIERKKKGEKVHEAEITELIRYCNEDVDTLKKEKEKKHYIDAMRHAKKALYNIDAILYLVGEEENFVTYKEEIEKEVTELKPLLEEEAITKEGGLTNISARKFLNDHDINYMLVDAMANIISAYKQKDKKSWEIYKNKALSYASKVNYDLTNFLEEYNLENGKRT